MSLFSAWNNVADFLKSILPNEFLKFLYPFRARHQNNLPDRCRSLEGVNRVREDRLIAEKRQQFIEPHPLAAARGDDDGA